MDRVSIEIGPISFAYADYDAEHDVLYLSVGEPEEGVGEDTPEGHVIRYSPGTSRVVGLTLISPRRILERDGSIAVTVPETVEKSADELGPLVAAA
jgi:hypothetical protein